MSGAGSAAGAASRRRRSRSIPAAFPTGRTPARSSPARDVRLDRRAGRHGRHLPAPPVDAPGHQAGRPVLSHELDRLNDHRCIDGGRRDGLPGLGRRRDAPADRLGDHGRRPGPGESRPVQLLQRVRRQSAGRRVLARRCDATARKKDTLLNLEAVGEFVLNAAVEDLAEKVNATSKELPPGQSEADYAGLTLEPSAKVRPPRVAESPVHLECRVRQIMSIGDGPIAANLVIGEVVLIHIADSVLDDRGARRSRGSCARSPGWAADYYCRSTDLFEMERP